MSVQGLCVLAGCAVDARLIKRFTMHYQGDCQYRK